MILSVKKQTGFTIVELIVIIVVIGILTGVTVVGYGSWHQRIGQDAVKSDLNSAVVAMDSIRNFDNSYPLSLPITFKASQGVTMTYVSGDATKFCIEAVSDAAPDATYFIDSAGGNKEPQPGNCADGGGGDPETPPPPSGELVWTEAEAGTNSSCGIASGKAYCWGSKPLGDGTSNNSNEPVAVDTSGVLNGKTVTDIARGENITCAVADGKVYCWGNNSNGQLGDGTTTSRNSPVATLTNGALSGKTIKSVTVGSYHACALDIGGKVYCWGSQSNGRIGNGQTSDTVTDPVAVNTSGVLSGKTVTEVSNGYAHTCVVASGQAYCWGNNNTKGRLGNNSTADSNVPVAVYTGGVLSGKTVTAIDTGADHTCVVASGKAYCWGENDYFANKGKLGNNSSVDSKVPVAVTTSGALSGKTVTAIAAGELHSCAIANGAAYCWGGNSDGSSYGVLGNGTNGADGYSRVPVAVDTSGALNGKSLSNLSIGELGYHTVTLVDGKIYTWGNNYGVYGNGSTANSLVPVAQNP